MSRGCATIEAPHICGELIKVEIWWSSSPGSYYNPPDWGEEWVYPELIDERCSKCGVDLGWDELFQATVESLKKNINDWGDDPGDGPDYEPDEGDEPIGHGEEWDEKYPQEAD